MPVRLVKSREAEDKPRVSYCRVVWDTAYTFWHTTSVAALGHSSRSPYLVLRLGWLMLFVVGVYFTFHDALAVFNNYLERPYSSQIKTNNKAEMDFPAVTICNQNRVSCEKLLGLMLDNLSQEDILEFYISSDCGPDTLHCNTVLESYENHFGESGTPPDTLLRKDKCLQCDEIASCWCEQCDRDEGKASQSFEFWWKKLDCFKKLSESPGDSMPPRTFQIPISLAKCPDECSDERSNEKPPRKIPPGNSFSVPPSHLTAGSPNGSITEIRDSPVHMNWTYSSTRSNVLQAHSENVSYTDTISFREILHSATTGYAADQKIPTNPPTAKSRRKRSPMEHDDDGFSGPRPDSWDPGKRMEASEQYNNKMNFLIKYVLLPDDVKKEVGYDFEDLFLDCKFMGYNCTNSSFFEPFYSPTYGNCYIYNYGGEEFVTLPGTTYSFSVVLNIKQDTYLPNLLTDKVGVRLAVHRPLTLPRLDEDAADLSPGMASSVAIREVEYTRLPYPQGSCCTANWTNTSYFPATPNFDQTTEPVYASSTCLNMCAQRMFIDGCNCAHPLLPLSFYYSGKLYKNMLICNLTSNHNDSTCMRNHLISNNSYLLDDKECDCSDACSEKVYPRVVSSTAWPPNSAKRSLHETYNMSTKVTNNLLAVEVFFQTLVGDSVVENPQYPTLNSLVSSLGGALSLYLGISLILLAELLEFLLCLIHNSVLYALGRYSSPREDLSPQQPSRKSSVSPSVSPRPPSSFSITTKTNISDLMSANGIDKLLEALTTPVLHKAPSNSKKFKSRVFDGAFHH